jgi:hypothetical protein
MVTSCRHSRRQPRWQTPFVGTMTVSFKACTFMNAGELWNLYSSTWLAIADQRLVVGGNKGTLTIHEQKGTLLETIPVDVDDKSVSKMPPIVHVIVRTYVKRLAEGLRHHCCKIRRKVALPHVWWNWSRDSCMGSQRVAIRGPLEGKMFLIFFHSHVLPHRRVVAL